MAVCPKCNKKLRLYNWRPECPYCGVNMVYYNSNDRLLAETEQAEIEHALSQPGIDRAKASFFGSVPAIIRIVLSLLPVGALFLPLAKIKASGGTINVTAIEIYKLISDKGIFPGSVLINASMLMILFSVVMILVCLGCLVMSLGKHGKIRNLILNILLTGSAVLSCVFFTAGSGSLSGLIQGFESAKPAVGIFVYIALTLVIMIYNLYLNKKGLKIKHTVCYIGGLKSEDYFAMKEQGVSDFEIRKKMVEALTAMQEEVRAKAAEEEAKKQAELASRK